MGVVVLFGSSMYDWSTLTTIYRQFNRISPAAHTTIPLDKPRSFAAIFQNEDTGWTNSQIFAAFLILIPSKFTVNLISILQPIRVHRLIEDMADLLLCSGTLEDWKLAVTRLDNNTELCYNKINEQLKQLLRRFEV